ncbi:MAG TPA: hypothetical protein DCE23_06115 [Firmicutes bacterium]|nr:hypothetical protein [Bacillota bacterium]
MPDLRFSNYTDLLDGQSIIYIYGKDKELATQQLSIVNGICKNKNLPISKVYMDIGGSNRLDNKINLKKLINENKNNNILASSVSRLTRDTFELLNLKHLCYKKNLNVFDLTNDRFIFDKSFEMLENLFSKGSDENLQRNLDILLVKPNKLPVKKTIRNTLEEKEKLVGGDIQYTYLENCNDVAIVYNENSNKLNLPINRDIGHSVISGNFFIVGDDAELGEDRSLTKKQIDKYTNYFGKISIEKINKMKDKSYNGLSM